MSFRNPFSNFKNYLDLWRGRGDITPNAFPLVHAIVTDDFGITQFLNNFSETLIFTLKFFYSNHSSNRGVI